MIENYKSNSNKSKDESVETPTQRVEKIISGKATTKKRTITQKVGDLFISGDAVDIKQYLIWDVIIPSIKKAIVDAVSEGSEMLFLGKSGGRSTYGGTLASRVTYNRYESKYGQQKTQRDDPLSNYRYDEIVLDNRGDAEEVLNRLIEQIQIYGMASVGDLYDFVGITGEYTNYKYGWTDLRNAYTVRVKNGYLIKLPKAMPL